MIRFASSPARRDDVSVAVGDFRSDADEDDAAKEREETKRLLYVALTRARDRLYLGSVLKEGRLQPRTRKPRRSVAAGARRAVRGR